MITLCCPMGCYVGFHDQNLTNKFHFHTSVLPLIDTRGDRNMKTFVAVPASCCGSFQYIPTGYLSSEKGIHTNM